MVRFTISFLLVTAVASACAAQEFHSHDPVSFSVTDTSSAEYSPAPATTYLPGDGITVSLLDDSSRLKLFGQFSLLGVFSTTRPFPSGNPFFLFPLLDPANDTNTFDLHARQTAFGAAFTGPEVHGLTPGAQFLAFLFSDNFVSDNYGFLPVSAYGELKNDRFRFSGGLQSDVFNPVGPKLITIADLSFSGDAGAYRGQLRFEHFYKPSNSFELTTQIALSEPTSTVFTNNSRLLEDNGWPNVEGRVATGLGPMLELAGGRTARPIEFGVSGVVGELRNAVLLPTPDTPPAAVRSVVLVWGLGVDGRVAVTDRFGVAGEGYVGQSLGEYNAMIGQTFGQDLRPIRGAGCFGEVYFYFTDQLHVHAGYGIDAAVVRDLTPAQIANNQTYFSNVIWDMSRVVQISTAVQYRRTDYVSLPDADGLVFLAQFLCRF